jgi:general secretion pathway protein F
LIDVASWRVRDLPHSEPNSLPTITLEQWIALNQEIAALVRAGVPLEAGLAEVGADLPGRLGRIATDVAARMEQGQSLAALLAEQSQSFPPVYRAVVEAGLRSGRLTVALEGLATTARRLADTRRVVATAFIYPLIVLLVAWGLFVVFTVKVAPVLTPFFRSSGAPGTSLLGTLARWGQSAESWTPVLPVVVVVLAVAWWFLSAGSGLMGSRWILTLGWVPGATSVARWLHAAALADTLALLVENDVPLDEAVVLAGRASGDRAMDRAAAELAACVRRGELLTAPPAGTEGFPPVLRWLMSAEAPSGRLVPALRHAAETYHGRAVHQAEMIRMVLPIALTVAVGGTATVLFAFMLFGPWIALIRHLAGA